MYYMHNLIFNMQRTMVLGHRSFCFHFTITIFIEMNLMRLYITIIMDYPHYIHIISFLSPALPFILTAFQNAHFKR